MRSAARKIFLLSMCGFIGHSTFAAEPAAVLRGGCTHDIDCDDGLPCTIDVCDFPPAGPAGSGSCQHSTVPDGQSGGTGGPDCAERFGLLCGGCDDGLFCNGAEACQAGACVPGTPPCSGGQVCSESLNLCQPGPCSETKLCVGGPNEGLPCTGNNTCSAGGLCRYADCHDGLHCNGEETCVAGVCQAGENPCDFGAACGERQCSAGAGVDLCISDADCAGGLGTCSLIGPVCFLGNCCINSVEPLCSVRRLGGFCSGSLVGSNAGAACAINADCNTGFCAGASSSCKNVGGRFYPVDDYISCSACTQVCWDANTIDVRCAKSSSGIAPHGDVVGYAGAVSNSNVANPLVGMPIHKLGDDYKFTNTGVCLGGSRNGLGCADNIGCPNGGVCNLAGPSVMSVYYVRALIGFSSVDTRVVVEFRDSTGRFVAESHPERTTVAGRERFFLDSPLIVPSEGFVVLRIATEYNPNDRFMWASTDAVDVGFNDPDVLWVNDGPVANFLAPSPGILAFEIEGEKVVAPLGACCDSDSSDCTDGVLPWVCEGDGNHFQGAGSTCPVPACDAGACCATSGVCTTSSESDCTTAGGDFQGYGTDCDPDCCVQPVFSGGDICEDTFVHVLTLPPVGESQIITISGNNFGSTLQSGETQCCQALWPSPLDLGWYEAFAFDGCGMVKISFCCTDPPRHSARPILFDVCPCSRAVSSIASPYDGSFPDHAYGEPFCHDANLWATFGPLSGGTYYIPVPTPIPGSSGDYQLQIHLEACSTAACCVDDLCFDNVNQFQCDDLDGFFLAPPQKAITIGDCSSNPCATGSCCDSQGNCDDQMQFGNPLTKEYCQSVQGTYTGGIRCHGGVCEDNALISCSINSDCFSAGPCLGSPQELAQPSPCLAQSGAEVCEIDGQCNCQPFENTLSFTLSDRSLGSDGMLSTDDFRPEGTVLDHVCVWGFYLDTDPDASVSDCAPSVVSDHFRVRVFVNDSTTGRSPGMLFGESWATSQRGIVPGTLIQTRLQVEVYGYELVLNSPIVGLTAGAPYWIEISNDVSDSLETCNWFWSQHYHASDAISFAGTESGYLPLQAVPVDNAFCLNMGFSPIPFANLSGPCCTCDGNCSVDTLYGCMNKNGIWDITRTTCDGVVCPSGPPANDNCIDGPQPITDGSYTVSNQCATTDGFGPIGEWPSSQIDYDLWYYFYAQQACDMVVSECQTGLLFDSALAVYANCPGGPINGCDATICPPCPLDASTSANHLAGITQDESCTGTAVGGAGYWQASDQIGRYAMPGECFLIRVGSFPGSRGTAILDISCQGGPVDPNPIDPQSNAVCTGAGIPDPCCSGIGVGSCNQSRFISFTPPSYPGATALRVKLTSLHHVVPPYGGGASIPFTAFEGQSLYVGPPVVYQESTANPTPFSSSSLQCTPYYQDWSTVGLLHVTDSAIVPSSIYHVEYLAAACMGVEGSAACQSGGANVSAQTELRTTRWGDVEAPYSPPSQTLQPDLADVSALLNKFRNAPGAPIKARALLAGVDAFGNLNLSVDFDFTHIAACVDAFRGRPYGYQMQSCP